MQRREFVLTSSKGISASLLASTGATLLTACGGGSSSGSDAPIEKPVPDPAPAPPPPALTPTFPKYSVFPAGNDHRIFATRYEDGSVMTVAGTKDAKGKPLAFNEIWSTANDGADNVVTYIGDSSAPKVTTVTDGTITTMEGTAVKGYVFGFSAGGKQLQVSLPGTSKNQSAHSVDARGRIASRIGVPSNFAMQPSPCGCSSGQVLTKQTAQAAKADSFNPPIVDVDISGCLGELPTVQVLVRDQNGRMLDVVKASKVGKYKYAAVLKVTNSADAEIAQAAKDVIDAFEAWDITEGAFGSIFAYLKSSTVEAVCDSIVDTLTKAGQMPHTLSEFQKFLGLTDAQLVKAEAIAKFKAALGSKLNLLFKGLGHVDTLKKLLTAGTALSSVLASIDALTYNKLTVQGRVITSKGARYVSVVSKEVSPEGPYPAVSVAAEFMTEISSLVLNPSHPGEGQSYQATGTVFCLTSGDIVKISIEGSDGYSDANEATVSSEESKDFILNVPGAESGVRDVVTIEVTRAGLKVASQTASLVFG